MVNVVVMELFTIMKEGNIVEIGQQIKCMERVLFITLMVGQHIKEIGVMILYMVEVFYTTKILFRHKDLMITVALIPLNNAGFTMKVVFKRMINVETGF